VALNFYGGQNVDSSTAGTDCSLVYWGICDSKSRKNGLNLQVPGCSYSSWLHRMFIYNFM